LIRNTRFKKCINIMLVVMFMLSLMIGQAPLATAKTLQTPIATPSNDTVVLNVNVGGVTLPYTWGDVTGAAGYKFAGQATTDTYLSADPHDTCYGIKFADLLANIESTLSTTLPDDYKVKAVCSDAYANTPFTVAEARNATNHYLLANKVNETSDSCIGYNSSDPNITYPATYLRIARNRGGNYATDVFGNTAYMRLISSLQITQSDNTAVTPPSINLAQNNGLDLASLTPATVGLVIGGSGITNGAGLQHSFVYLSQAQIDYIKANKSVGALGLGSSWTSSPLLYSSYDNHGTPEYVYRLAEGINLKTALTALGADVMSATVAIEATASDAYSKIVDDAFGVSSSRNYIAPNGSIGQAVDPLLVFYDDKVETSSPDSSIIVPTQDSIISDPNPLFVYGQKSAAEQTNCSFVKNTVKIRAGIDTPAFTLSNGTTTKSISLSDIALLGIYQTSYSWFNGSTPVTQSLIGVPLSTLLTKLGISVPSDKGLIINVNNGSGSAPSSRTISYNEIGKCFVVFDAFENSQRVAGCTTPLRIYCPGQTQTSVLIENVVGAAVGTVTQTTVGIKEPGGDVSNSVFYIAVKDSAASETKYYYYTKAELQAYEKQEAYTYDDHSVIKTVTCKGALLTDLLSNLQSVVITGDSIVQYAEEDGYHADAAKAVINSNYKDMVNSLTQATVSGSGSTKNPMRPMVTYAIHEEYATPDTLNVNDPAGVFKDADNNSGYLRVYRDTADANSAVMKYIMGVVVSSDGALLSGTNGCLVRSVSSKNPALKVRDDITIKGLIPGMQYAVRAPRVTNANLAASQANPIGITVGSGAPANQVVSFQFVEDTYFYVKNALTNTTTNYTYTDLMAIHTQVPDASTNTAPYGYSRPMYYRYNGVWLSNLLSGLSGDYIIRLVAKDGSKLDITNQIAQYFAAYNNTQSKTNTNIPESKRVTISYNDARIIIPSQGENVTGSSATDYTLAGKDVGVLMAAAEGLEIIPTTLQATSLGYILADRINSHGTFSAHFKAAANGSTVSATIKAGSENDILADSFDFLPLFAMLRQIETEQACSLDSVTIGTTTFSRQDIVNNFSVTYASIQQAIANLAGANGTPYNNLMLKQLNGKTIQVDFSGQTINLTIKPADECFIATAAFGSKFTWPVQLLRHFRDQYLLTNSLGSAFVSLYYRHSPPIAAIIAGNGPLKTLVRVLLAPVVGLVYLLYNPLLLVSLLLALIMFCVYRSSLRRRIKQA